MRYIDRNLQRFFADLSPRNRKKVIKGACRKVGNSIRKIAVNNLRLSGLNHASELSSGVRVVVFNREAGVRVTVASRKANRKTGKGEKGMHLNRYGLKKPVLVWAEAGTKWRKVKTDKKARFKADGKWYTAGTRHRGFMRRYGFIAKTETQIKYTAGDQIKDELENHVKRIAKENGCT